MNSKWVETSDLYFGKGCVMRFLEDPSQPEDSIDRRGSEVIYDGKPDSWVPVIGSHWHKIHEEYMTVHEGRVKFTVDGKTTILTPSSEPLHIPTYAVHDFAFFKGERTVLVERTDPTGGFKQEFFRDLFEFSGGEGLSLLTVTRAFYDGDSYVALPFGIKWLDEAFTLIVGRIGTFWYPPRPAALTSDGQSLKNPALLKKTS